MVHRILIRHDSCTGCALCTDACPVPVIEFDEETKKPAVIDKKGCLVCRNCEELCPTRSIKIELHPREQDL